MSTEKIQRVELSCYDHDIHCPFCGTNVFKEDSEDPCNPELCNHVLFVATDEGFEYMSSDYKRKMGLENDADFLSPEDMSIDEFTNQFPSSEAIKLAVYIPAPSMFGVYYGFSATG